MATRSFIGIRTKNGYRCVYVHYDGYLDGVGAELQDYVTESEVEDLISYGDRSSLDCDYYSALGENWEDIEPREYNTFEEFFTTCIDSGAEWYYIFREGVWYCGNTYMDSNLFKQLVPYRDAVVIYQGEEQLS